MYVFIFSYNILPVVMGARPEDYAAALPPHSYIHVDDFPSPQELAKYLLRLNANDTMYNEYFQWKSKWYEVSNFYHWCRICGLLHAASELKYVHWYENYSRWFDGDEVKTCGARWVEQNGNKWQTWRRFDLVWTDLQLTNKWNTLSVHHIQWSMYDPSRKYNWQR